MSSSRHVSVHTVKKLSCTSTRNEEMRHTKMRLETEVRRKRDIAHSFSRKWNGTSNRHSTEKPACDRVQEMRKRPRHLSAAWPFLEHNHRWYLVLVPASPGGNNQVITASSSTPHDRQKSSPSLSFQTPLTPPLTVRPPCLARIDRPTVVFLSRLGTMEGIVGRSELPASAPLESSVVGLSGKGYPPAPC